MRPQNRLAKNGRWLLATVTALSIPIRVQAQLAGHNGWIEEPGTKSLIVEGDSGRLYLDTTSVHRGGDGLVYFNESSGVERPEQIGKVGLMEDAYDCAKNIKYMCVEKGDWRNDRSGMVDTAKDPALPIYRKYLCGDANPSGIDSRDVKQP